MKTTDFEEANFTFTAPPDMDNCGDLRVFRDGERIISALELTKEEILNLLIFRRVWLHIWGQAQPPIYLETTSPFVNAQNVVRLADADKVTSIKRRLVRDFLTRQTIQTDLDVTELIKSKDDFEGHLKDFLDFLCERGID